MCLVFGVISGSDAYLLSRAIVLAAAIMIVIFRYVPVWLAVPLGSLLALGAARAAGYDLFEHLQLLWSSADEGGRRLMIYRNGLSAWLDNPFSFIISLTPTLKAS